MYANIPYMDPMAKKSPFLMEKQIAKEQNQNNLCIGISSVTKNNYNTL